MLVFASMGAITWAIRGTSGWGGIDGTVVPGMTWGVLWWYVCWRKGIDARGVSLFLGLGIALGGELGYGQYVSWIRGMFNVDDAVIPVAPWVGYAWFAICGVGWAAPGGIALGWTLAGRKSLGAWLARLVIPVGIALLARIVVQTCPWLFFPNWVLGVYDSDLSVAAVNVVEWNGSTDALAAAGTQKNMIVTWLVSVLLSGVAWLSATKIFRPGWLTRGISFCAVLSVIALLLLVADWLFFPDDRLGLFTRDLGRHLGRTVYTNSQNAIVVGWWIGALMVAAMERDRHTLFAGLVLGVGLGVGFPLAALWCLGYAYAPTFIDWWKMWELNSGFTLGLLYASVLYWTIRPRDDSREGRRDDDASSLLPWVETIAMALTAFLVIYVMAREEFLTVGILLGAFYAVAMFLTSRQKDGATERRRAVSFVFSAFLLVFIMAWGASAQTGILLGLYEADAVDQYEWPAARVAIFAPACILIFGAAMLKMRQAVRDPRVGLPPVNDAPCISARIVDLMALTSVVGAASIWPSKIGVLYALFLWLALYAFNRLNRCFDASVRRRVVSR